MRNKEEFKQLMMDISEKAGDNSEIMDLLKSAQEDYNELSDSKSTYSDKDVMDTDGKKWSDKYSELRQQYRDRFFGGSDEPDGDPGPGREPEPAPAKDDPTKVTFDDLFTEHV